MTKLETAKTEIRAIFDNEIECTAEGEAKVGKLVIFERTIRFKSNVSHVVYAIHPDGYWEQVACHVAAKEVAQ